MASMMGAFGAFGRIPLQVYVLLATLFMLLASDWIFGIYSDMVSKVLLYYIVFYVALMAAFRTGMMPAGSVGVGLRSFSIMFILTAAIVYFIPTGAGGALMSGQVMDWTKVKMALGFGLLHGFVKAYIEESSFRGILLGKLGMVPSNIAFGLFHIGAVILTLTRMQAVVTFQAVAVPVMILTGLGFIWTFIYRRFGLMGAVGSHLAYNLKAFGVLGRVLGL